MDTGVLTALSTSIGALLRADLTSLSDSEVLALTRQVEVLRRRLETFDHVVVPELQRRNVSGRDITGGVHRLLASVWNLTVTQADQRVMHSIALAPRLSLTGERMGPMRPALAEARAEGAVSAQHVQVITSALRSLPSELPVDEVTKAERILVEAARVVDPRSVQAVGRRLRDTIDPDGSYRDPEAQLKRRCLTLMDLPDGMVRIVGTLDAETGALARAALGALAAPLPSTAAGNDMRSPGERQHDALKSVCSLALRSDELPTSGGVPASVIVSMTVEQFESRTGIAHTSTGQRISVPEAMRLAGESSIAWVVHNSVGGVLNYGTTKRIATEKQTLALISRDHGCAFPGCQSPPEWGERHHVVPWASGGPTNLDNLVLLCRYHHDHHQRLGWTIEFRDKVPWFIPPAWRDPCRTAIRNTRC